MAVAEEDLFLAPSFSTTNNASMEIIMKPFSCQAVYDNRDAITRADLFGQVGVEEGHEIVVRSGSNTDPRKRFGHGRSLMLLTPLLYRWSVPLLEESTLPNYLVATPHPLLRLMSSSP